MVHTAIMITAFYDDTLAFEDDECELRIDDDKIVVSYEDDDGVVIYAGKEQGDGHYILKCPERSGEATLHRLKGSKILEGHWIEDGAKGFWRLRIVR